MYFLNARPFLDHTDFSWESLRFLHGSGRANILHFRLPMWADPAQCRLLQVAQELLLGLCSLCDNFSSSVGDILKIQILVGHQCSLLSHLHAKAASSLE